MVWFVIQWFGHLWDWFVQQGEESDDHAFWKVFSIEWFGTGRACQKRSRKELVEILFTEYQCIVDTRKVLVGWNKEAVRAYRRDNTLPFHWGLVESVSHRAPFTPYIQSTNKEGWKHSCSCCYPCWVSTKQNPQVYSRKLSFTYSAVFLEQRKTTDNKDLK